MWLRYQLLQASTFSVVTDLHNPTYPGNYLAGRKGLHLMYIINGRNILKGAPHGPDSHRHNIRLWKPGCWHEILFLKLVTWIWIVVTYQCRYLCTHFLYEDLLNFPKYVEVIKTNTQFSNSLSFMYLLCSVHISFGENLYNWVIFQQELIQNRNVF